MDEERYPALPWQGWKIVKRLGRGGYGSVYLAQRNSAGVMEDAAVKVISFPKNEEDIEADFTDGYDLVSVRNKYKNMLHRYVDEYQIMLAFKGQTNIVSCDDFEAKPHKDGIGWDVFIRMELLTPLTTLIKQYAGIIPEEMVIKVGKDICSALMLCDSKNIVHRDIKPENILILGNRLVLSDFGLYWGIEEERLTEFNERIGPYKIMPPELENVQTDLDLDFRPSDVYLFAKVLWMTLKGDNIGFRGQYQRGDVQIFLNKENFGDVITLEPIHKLIEQATFEDMNKRISIHQCIDYLELQRNLLDGRERELLSNELVSRLLYDKHSKMIIERTKPDELIYEDKGTIFSMLRGVIPISKIMVKSLNDEQKAKQIQLTDFQVGSGGICKMLYFNNGIKVKEYIMEINKMTYSHLNLDIVLELNDIDSVDKEYVAYSETVRGFGNMYPKIYFSSDEKIIITKVK